MRLIFFVTLISLTAALQVNAQKGQTGQFKIAFYNTENCFDTIDDPNKSDEDFLPSSKVAWTSARYTHKINNIARALASIDSVNLPAIIGLAEVENISVLNDLITKTRLRSGNYQAILEEGSDPRGIDVALIFRKNIMKYISHHAFPSAQSFKTRSVLYVRLADAKKDTFHLFVNHWKSRSGGATETEPQRLENATTLKHLTDSLLARNPKSNIVIMGDFNDEPANKSLSEVLGAQQPGKKITPTGLYNLMYERFLKGEGTLYYKDWDLFDQFVVTGNLLEKKNGKGAVIRSPYAYIFKPEWLLYKNKAGEMLPNRTAGSKEYFGGYSDHMPVYVTVFN
ncbi:MAG: hypothetical protein NT040_09620 [Bacteroidetes bacterium]|nr:hypothetical protein [Bacteroidota bacterium]